jgi:hypothetical protein
MTSQVQGQNLGPAGQLLGAAAAQTPQSLDSFFKEGLGNDNLKIIKGDVSPLGKGLQVHVTFKKNVDGKEIEKSATFTTTPKTNKTKFGKALENALNLQYTASDKFQVKDGRTLLNETDAKAFPGLTAERQLRLLLGEDAEKASTPAKTHSAAKSFFSSLQNAASSLKSSLNSLPANIRTALQSLAPKTSKAEASSKVESKTTTQADPKTKAEAGKIALKTFIAAFDKELDKGIPVGIFRISVNNERLSNLRNDVNNNAAKIVNGEKNVTVPEGEEQPHFLACAVKQFIREGEFKFSEDVDRLHTLRDGITDENRKSTMDEMKKILDNPKNSSIKTLLMQLAPTLDKIMKDSEKNKMHAGNLAIVIGPNIFTDIMNSGNNNATTEFILKNLEDLGLLAKQATAQQA